MDVYWEGSYRGGGRWWRKRREVGAGGEGMVEEEKEGWDDGREGKGLELERRRRVRRNRVGGGGRGELFRFREAPWRVGLSRRLDGVQRWWRGRRKRESMVGTGGRVTTRRCC
ncbi:hypothetical protein BHE74_00057850 [Ensete ventricosum]|nr:hypothetical protein BHE74_00057850 [Ensete ventricosum]